MQKPIAVWILLGLTLSIEPTHCIGSEFTNSIGMTFVEINSGSFIMGTEVPSCPNDNPSTKEYEQQDCAASYISVYNKEISHSVNIGSYYIQTTEVTQGQWEALMKSNPSRFISGSKNKPVERVRFSDVQEFIKKLNEKEKTTLYRLPTEEEWEYAARAGTTTNWYNGNNPSQAHTIAVVETDQPAEVGSKTPNAWGLYDTAGNVWEFTNDCPSKYQNPEEDCLERIIRGGGWNDIIEHSISQATYGSRRAHSIFLPFYDLGFRLMKMKQPIEPSPRRAQ